MTIGTGALGQFALGQSAGTIALDLTTGSPSLGSPSASVYYPLTASGLTTGSPSLATPSASVYYPLTATALTTGSPSLGSPTFVCPLGIDALVKLLLHGDGSNNSTTIVDSAPTAHTMTAHSNAKLTTTGPKFGSAAMMFDGSTSDYIDTPDSTDFALGTGDFTIDFWFNNTGGGTIQRICGHQSDFTAANTSFHFSLDTGTLSLNVSNGSAITTINGTSSVSTNTWHHVAGVRTGNTLKLFYDGVQEGGDASFSGSVPHAGHLSLGRRGDVTSQYFTGLIDEFRLSVGMPRWLANFTPPTKAYGYCCAPSGFATASPVLDTPLLFYTFIASDLSTTSPVLGTPDATAYYPITASGLTTSSPVLGAPAAAVYYPLTASDLTTSSPALDAPAASVFYAFTASDLTTSSPVLGTPATSVYYVLTASALTTASPALGTPFLGTGGTLFADDLETGSPALDAPVLTAPRALDLTTSSPALGTPAASVNYPLVASGLTTGSPALGAPTISVHYTLTAAALITASPALGSPAAAAFYPLIASPLITASPALGTPFCGVGGNFVALNLATGSPVLGAPAPSVFYALIASTLATASPALDSPPAIVVPDLVTGSPALDAPALLVFYPLIADDLTTASPDLGTPPYGVFFDLVAEDLTTQAPELDQPLCEFTVMPKPEWEINLGDALLDPIYNSVVANPARVFPATSGLPFVDLYCINHTNGIQVSFGIAIQTIRPAIDIRVREIEIFGIMREDLTGGQVILWPDTNDQQLWNIETVFPRPGIWGEPVGELRLFLMDRQS